MSSFLCRVWVTDEPDRADGRVVWTLPEELSVDGIARDSYAKAAVELVDNAKNSVLLVSPYLEPRGMGLLQGALLDALRRDTSVTLLTHGAEDLSSLASASLESLRRESSGLPGTLIVFTALTASTVLLHSKIVIADGVRAIVGSANLTGKGLGRNLEAGTLLGPEAAVDIERVVNAVIAQGLVERAFCNH